MAGIPRNIGIQFMGDLFHRDISFSLIEVVFGVMALVPQHTLFVLTKREERLGRFIAATTLEECIARVSDMFLQVRSWISCQRVIQTQEVQGWPPRNIITGCSISNQPEADHALPEILRIPGRHWVSIEPGLGMIQELWPYLMPGPITNCEHADPEDGCCTHPEALTPECHPNADCPPIGKGPRRQGLCFVAMGGETGKGARPLYPPAARSVRGQCGDAGVPFYFKHWGEYAPGCDYYRDEDDTRERALDRPNVLVTPSGSLWDIDLEGQPPSGTWIMHRVGRRKAGRLLDGREYNELPEAEMTEEQLTLQPPASFSNPLEVSKYLKKAGWKVEKDTVYRGVKDGKLRAGEDGRFSREAVEKYAAAFLTKAKTRQHLKDTELSRRARQAEIELKEEQTKLARIKIAEREGRMIPREQFAMELAARAATLEAGLKHLVQDRVADWIQLVAGDQAQLPELLRVIHLDLDRALNEYASTREFHVLFEQTEDLTQRRNAAEVKEQ